MNTQQNITFQDALDAVETLPEEQQENLIDIIGRRLIEHRRQVIADNIATARAEYARGEVNKGSVGDLMKELAE